MGERGRAIRGGNERAVVQHRDIVGVPLRPRRRRQLRPRRSSSGIEIHRPIDPARRAVDHGGVKPVQVVWVQRQPNHRPAEMLQPGPRGAPVGRIHDFAAATVNVGILAIAVPGVHIVNGRHRGIKPSVGRMIQCLVGAIVGQ